MVINIHNLNSAHIIATNIWKYFYAQKQHESFPNNPNYNINFVDSLDVNESAISVLHVGFNAIKSLTVQHVKDFDIVIIDNNVDHAQVHDEIIYEFVSKYSNVYFLIGGFVINNYSLSDKILSYSADWIDCMQLYSDPLCFTRYSINKNNNKQGMLFIGGALRSWRKFIIDMLPSKVKVHQKTNEIAGTKHIIGGTKYDQPFIDMCNQKYNVNSNKTPENEFYSHLTLGLEHLPAGGARLGYYAIPEYSDNQCIIFPEACFVNHHVFPTEKLWKCVAAKTHWIMFSGADSYKILRDYGIRSIVELVPNGINFDKIQNHEERFIEQIRVVDYLSKHQEIFNSDDALEILNDNFEMFYNNHRLISQLVEKINSILITVVNK